MAEHGADVVLAARRREPLERTAADIQALGRRTLVVPTDVTAPDQCKQLISTTLAEFGHLDVLVNNAGGGQLKALMDWSLTDWQETLTLNLVSAWILSRCAAEPMLEQGKGTIVNVSSGASLLTMPNAAPTVPPKRVSTTSPEPCQRASHPGASVSTRWPSAP
jgi:NAD(P)-dependent dehydrogenase (short-subunit alcohol dehydrogenase family)